MPVWIIFYYFCVRKEKIKKILKEILLFVIQFAFSRFQFGACFPLGISYAFLRVFLGGNLFVITVEYLVSNLFLIFDFYLFLCVCFEIVILSLYYFFRSTIKTKKKKLFLFLFVLLSSMLKLYFSISEKGLILYYFIELVGKYLFLLFLLKVHTVFQNKFVFLKCSNLDYLLFSFFVVLFVLGLFQYEFLTKALGLTLFALTILVASRFLPTDKYLIFAISLTMCFGIVLSSTKLFVIAIFVIVLLVFISRIQKYLFMLLSLVILTIVCWVSGEVDANIIISLISSLILFVFIPQKTITKLMEFFEDKSVNIIKENLWKENECDIRRKLVLMSKTLMKMRDDFKFLLVGKIDRVYASKELAKEIICKNCLNCENKIICANSIIDKEKLLSEYVYHAILNGGVSQEELTVGFRTYCNKTGIVVREINKISKQFVEFETSVKTEDDSKLLISTELENFANLFNNFAKNMEKSPKINKNLSAIAKEMLANYMIDVCDVGVFESERGIEKIDVVAENNSVMRKEMVEALSKITRCNIQIKKLKHLELSGLSLVTFCMANELKLEFAISSSSKERVSGDNTVIVKLDDNRYFVAIADGMGHGKLAGKTSSMILELIKNMFLIGIDLDILVDSINKLLLPIGLENFSTLDAVVVDLRLKKCMFLKLGSSVSAIKHKDKTEIVVGESLPVGIVQTITPTLIVKPIKDGDIIVLSSDGVVDSFDEIDDYKIFINDCKVNDLQRFADNVIFELNLQPNKHKDDMSIIALKLLKNSVK